MVVKRPLLVALAASLAIVPALAACSSGAGDGSSTGGPAGDPVSGGVANVLVSEEPRNLDPAVLQNNLLSNGLVGNALYGTLMYESESGDAIEYGLAESFETDDAGKTFTLTLREGLAFTDGTPLDAAAVKYNWDRLADPALASNSQQDAVQIESNVVVDDVTLEVTMKIASPFFAGQVTQTGLNWIASPTALAKGAAAFDEEPAGAGPFMLDTWTRGGTIELTKNPDYYDAPRPYLDGLIIGSASDETQALNSVVSGGSDLGPATTWPTVADAEAAGLQVHGLPMNGGVILGFNTTAEPFDDIRARQAVSYALDLEALNLAVSEGEADQATTLFAEGTPLYTDTKLHTYDPDKAQELLDELAAEGKPLAFTFTAFAGQETLAEAVQAQMQLYDNVTVEIRKLEQAESGRVYGSRDFQMLRTASNFRDPEPQLYRSFFSTSARNSTKINDPELDAAILAGREADTVEERRDAYDLAAQRIAETVPAIFTDRSSQTVFASNKVGGIQLYGLGSLLVDRLWLAE